MSNSIILLTSISKYKKKKLKSKQNNTPRDVGKPLPLFSSMCMNSVFMLLANKKKNTIHTMIRTVQVSSATLKTN